MFLALAGWKWVCWDEEIENELACTIFLYMQVMSSFFILNLGLCCKRRSRPDGDWHDAFSFMYASKISYFHFGLD